ncbi:hypothetical protein EDB81DRAFT_620959, partial [Dactylonectria macrodidyma]
YQQARNQVTEGLFFDEAIGTSPISTEVSLGFPQPPPQYIMAAKIPEEYGPSRVVMPTVERENKPPRRPRNRQKSQESSSLLETGASALISDIPKPRKRGRKPKVEPKESPKARRKQKGESNYDEDLPKDPRGRRILERNRIAATMCRLRKQDETSALASREQAMEDQNRYLLACFNQLTTVIYHLKTQLLHTDCNCALIQKYIADEARKSVDGLLSCSSAFQLPDGLTPPHHRGSSGNRTRGTDSLSIQTPEMESAPPTWTNPFQQGSRSPEAGDNLFDMVLEPFQKGPLPVPSQ